MRNLSSAARPDARADVENRFRPSVRSIAVLLASLDQLVKDSPKFMPLGKRALIDGFQTRNSIMRHSFPGPSSSPAPKTFNRLPQMRMAESNKLNEALTGSPEAFDQIYKD
jgi:hypothetical protein